LVCHKGSIAWEVLVLRSPSIGLMCEVRKCMYEVVVPHEFGQSRGGPSGVVRPDAVQTGEWLVQAL
jgi:hypothetical protein